MRLEVRIEQLIIDRFPVITTLSTGWSGNLADLVTAILKETTPEYITYQDDVEG